MSSLSKNKDELTLEDIMNSVRTYIEDEEQIAVIEKAYYFAKEKHEGQFRKSGEAYIYHPMNVALILTSIYADYETISAGLIHDVSKIVIVLHKKWKKCLVLQLQSWFKVLLS